jgi:hypothetical protein
MLYENFGEDLIQILDKEQYRSWEKRVIGCPEPNLIQNIRQQIDNIEFEYKRSFDEEFEKYWGTRYEYHRLFSLSDNKSDLYIKIQKCDDEWYLVEVYSEWYYHWLLCDTADGLKYLSKEVINVLKKS